MGTQRWRSSRRLQSVHGDPDDGKATVAAVPHLRRAVGGGLCHPRGVLALPAAGAADGGDFRQVRWGPRSGWHARCRRNLDVCRRAARGRADDRCAQHHRARQGQAQRQPRLRPRPRLVGQGHCDRGHAHGARLRIRHSRRAPHLRHRRCSQRAIVEGDGASRHAPRRNPAWRQAGARRVARTRCCTQSSRRSSLRCVRRARNRRSPSRRARSDRRRRGRARRPRGARARHVRDRPAAVASR